MPQRNLRKVLSLALLEVLTEILNDRSNGGEFGLLQSGPCATCLNYFPHTSICSTYGVVNAFCMELLSPEYMDLVEQAIQAMSSQSGHLGFKEDAAGKAIEKLLAFIDFSAERSTGGI